MKNLFVVVALLGATALNAQSQGEIQNNLFDYLRNDAIIISSKGLLKGDKSTGKYVSSFIKQNGEGTYTKNFGISVNKILDYEIGEIKTNSTNFPVMFLKRKDNSAGPEVELLVIYEDENPSNEVSILDEKREEWMKLCNDHKADELVKQLYTVDAYYYNRGRLLQGTSSISSEYSYMNSPGYTLTLTPKHLAFVSPSIAYEIGQCSGSYPLPYMLLWEKQDNGNWQIMMDSNY